LTPTSAARRWNASCELSSQEDTMLYWALCFLVLAIIAGIFGFGGVAAASAGIAKVLFIVFLVALVMSAIFGFSRRARL
jgi:uncharacterized membrane protein YtjA (UPF0391 family)